MVKHLNEQEAAELSKMLFDQAVALTRDQARLAKARDVIEASRARLGPQRVYTPQQASDLIVEMFRTRIGEVMTEDLLQERARNVATVLAGCEVLP